MIALALALGAGCALDGVDSTDGDAPTSVDTATDTNADTDADALAADDARVRSLTGLPEGDSPCAAPQLVRVRETVDGDTFHALPEGESTYFKVRIIGVDTPEISHDGAPADCYGDEAWDYSAAALDGKLVWLTFDAECEDYYGRTLAYVFRGDDEAGFFNRALVRSGNATPLTVQPNDTYADVFAQDSRDARDEGLGLWSACDR